MPTMFSFRTLLLVCTLSICVLPPIQSQQQPLLYHDCVGKGNDTTNSPYQSNLNNLLISIYNNTEIDYGFYNFTYGEGTDKVYAIALCRPDITPATCRACIKNSSEALTTLCPNFKEAIGGLDDCMLRYTNRSIFNLLERGPYFWVYSLKNVTNVRGFNELLVTLLGTLREEAAAGDSRYKYGMRQITAPDNQTIYGLAQCTPDLSASDCRDCLYNASGLLPQCCEARSGGRVIYPSCNFRYEIGRFYETIQSPPPPASAKSTPPTSDIGNKNTTPGVVIIVVVSTVSALMLLIFC